MDELEFQVEAFPANILAALKFVEMCNKASEPMAVGTSEQTEVREVELYPKQQAALDLALLLLGSYFKHGREQIGASELYRAAEVGEPISGMDGCA